MESFFKHNWKNIILEREEFFLYQLYASNDMELKEYVPANDEKLIDFEKHLMDGYISGRGKEVYIKNWYNLPNMKRAEKITREGREIPESVIEALENYSDSLRDYVEPWDLDTSQENPNFSRWNIIKWWDRNVITQQDLFNHVEEIFNIKFKRVYTFFSWWNNLEKYIIYDGDHQIGEIYFKISDHPRTTPASPFRYGAINLVESPLDFNIPHELTHAVHYSYQDYFKVDLPVAEILAISVENKVRKHYGYGYNENSIRKQVGIALADIYSESPQEFNFNYGKYAKINNPGQIAARLWHYGRYSKQYWGYVVPLIHEFDNLRPLLNLTSVDQINLD